VGTLAGINVLFDLSEERKSINIAYNVQVKREMKKREGDRRAAVLQKGNLCRKRTDKEVEEKKGRTLSIFSIQKKPSNRGGLHPRGSEKNGK